MKDQILLVVLCPDKTVSKQERVFEHLGFGYIAAYLRYQGYSVKIIDQNLLQQSLENIIQQVVSAEPQLIGISCYQEAYPTLQEFVQKTKNILPDTHLCLGGVFATNAYNIIFHENPKLDSIVLGDGEETFSALADAIFNNNDWHLLPHLTYPHDPQAEVKLPRYDTDISSLPDAARDTLPLVIDRGLFPTIIGSRGCYGNCSYCSITIKNRKRRCREMSAVIDEMERLFKEYRADYFYFIDDTFIGGSKKDFQRVEKFAEDLEKRKLKFQFSIECRANEVDANLLRLLKNVGLYSVFLGIESGYQPTLDMFRKGITVEQNLKAVKTLNELGIRYSIGFIMFHPFTTLEEIEANLNFLMHTEQKNFLDSLHRRLMVFYNAPISKELQKYGITCNPWYDTSVSFIHPEIKPIFDFIEKFTAFLKPGINNLAVHYSQSNNHKEKELIAKHHSSLCSTYVDTLYQYTKNPEPKLLTDQMDHLINQYNSILHELNLSF